MDKNCRIIIMDENMLCNAIKKQLENYGYNNVKLWNNIDLKNEKEVINAFEKDKPEIIFCFAGPHGGIRANMEHSAEFLYENIKIQNNIIHNAYVYSVKKMIFMTGACVYPKECRQPIQEDDFMTGKMEETSRAYSTAKAVGIEMCIAYNKQYGTDFVPVPICNYYGRGDDFSESGHVLANIIRKVDNAKINGSEYVKLYGTGRPIRQFMHVDDVAKAAILIMDKYNKKDIINIGGGQEISIFDLAQIVKKIEDYSGQIIFDSTKPDGTMKKVCDGTKLIELGFETEYTLKEGIENVYEWYVNKMRSEINLGGYYDNN